MGFGRGKEHRPTPPEVYNWRIYGITFLTCFAAWCFGYNNGVIGGCIVLPSFHRDFNLPDTGTSQYNNIVSNIVSFTQIGAMIGSLLVFPIVRTFGRKPTLAIGGITYFSGAAMQYLAELAPPAIRGSVVGIAEINNQFASIFGYWSNFFVQVTVPGTESRQWQIPLGMQLIPGGLITIAAIFLLPESPRFLIEKGQSEKARKTLAFLRNLPSDHEYVDFEVHEVESAIQRQRNSPHGSGVIQLVKELFWKGNRNRLAFGLFLMWAANLSGINGVNFYTPSIFESIGFQGTTFLLLASGFYAISKGIATLLSLLFFVDIAGRKTILITASIGVSLTLFYVGIFITASHQGLGEPASRSAGGWVALVAIQLFAFCFSLGLNGVPWIFCAEVFPARIKELCISITTSTQWLAQFTISRITPYLLSNSFGGLFYFVFGATAVICCILIWLLLPETKGVTLERMDEIFGSPYRYRDEVNRTDEMGEVRER